jgi:hypothetical protein
MEQVVKELGNMNNTLAKILGVMEKPENPLFKALTIAGIIAGILGIIQVIDTIIKWL